MAGRIGYLMVAGAAIFTGMVVQGDINLGFDHAGHGVAKDIRDGDDGEIDRVVERIVDRATNKIEIRGDGGKTAETDPATKRALAAAVAELVRAEGSLITAKLDDDMPAAAIEQAEQRRDLAKQAVERIAANAKAGTRGIRDDVRESVRDAVRS